MPIHDWTRVDAGLFHAFHQRWISALCDALNEDLLPTDFYALQEQKTPSLEPDVLALKIGGLEEGGNGDSAVALATKAPKTRYVARYGADIYAEKADRISVRHRSGNVVAMIEIVSPGNKSSRKALDDFVDKAYEFVRAGVNLLIIDLFPPSKRDPQGIHAAIWGDSFDEPIALLPEKPLTLAAYQAQPSPVAYVEPVGVGDALPDMPLFLVKDRYVPTPLDATYETTWRMYPRQLKPLLEMPA